MTTPIAFTADQRNHIEALRRNLTQRTQRLITTEYGAADCGQQWAALCVDESADTLVSILVGPGVPGDAAVMAPDGAAVAPGSEFPEAIKAARFTAMRGWRALRRAAH
ncbi:hypothetical protein WKW80_09220 [Variovorax humicola]|uniref:Uncharacterized protein n=1 Tax=Variovorax humicola TaxID=1769758 RepID=A0ABU8VWS3_9BURK